MFSGGRWYGFRVGLVLACMSGALHVPQGGHAQPPPGTFNLMVPQFVAEAVRFTAIDESGYDWWGSDEVYAVFSDLNPSVFVGITAVRENVDTGDSHDFSPDERCLAPRPDCSGGVSEFLHFEFSFWERDDPPWPFSQFCHGVAHGDQSPLRRGVCPGDDLIGHGAVIMSREQLLAILPSVGDVVEYDVILGGPCGPAPECGIGWPPHTGPEYEFTYQIRRLPDVERPLVIAPPR